MPEFVSKPVRVEARRLAPETAADIYDWVIESEWRARLETINGTWTLWLAPRGQGFAEPAMVGDWVIRTPDGFKVCRPSEFEERYVELKSSETDGPVDAEVASITHHWTHWTSGDWTLGMVAIPANGNTAAPLRIVK